MGPTGREVIATPGLTFGGLSGGHDFLSSRAVDRQMSGPATREAPPPFPVLWRAWGSWSHHWVERWGVQASHPGPQVGGALVACGSLDDQGCGVGLGGSQHLLGHLVVHQHSNQGIDTSGPLRGDVPLGAMG